jgi:acetyl-CoA C-acetyltransferase
MNTHIIGWGHTPFRRWENDDVESLLSRVIDEALTDAGVEAADIDEIYLGHFNGGFVAQDFTASLALQSQPALRFKPATRLENACATGSAAMHAGVRAINSGQAHRVLVAGVEKMTDHPNVGEILARACYIKEESRFDSFAAVFAHIAQCYFDRYGDHSEALARIAAKNHRNGLANPYAQLRKEFGFEFCRDESDKNPRVAGPLKRTDCSPITDGAAALVLGDDDTARTSATPVTVRAIAQVNDFLPMSRRDMSRLEGCEQAWRLVLERAGLTLDDLSLVETHDCFTVAELMQYEAMGLTPCGEGARAIDEGWTERDGKLPVNLSGGLKSKGHPIGATGVSMHVMAAMQLADRAEAMQLPGARRAGVFNMGGSGVANYATILERTR